MTIERGAFLYCPYATSMKLLLQYDSQSSMAPVCSTCGLRHGPESACFVFKLPRAVLTAGCRECKNAHTAKLCVLSAQIYAILKGCWSFSNTPDLAGVCMCSQHKSRRVCTQPVPGRVVRLEHVLSQCGAIAAIVDKCLSGVCVCMCDPVWVR